MIHELIFHRPEAAQMAGTLLGLAISFPVRFLLTTRLTGSHPLDGFGSLVVFCVVMCVTRHDLHKWEFVAFIVWTILAASFPWDRWRKQLGSKISSMTAVAKAAFQRQQSEAFS